MANLVKVKILKHVGTWTPGEVVEVDQEMATHLCTATTRDAGGFPQVYQKAILLDEYEKIQAIEPDPKKMTQGELEALGKKNIVKSPEYPDMAKKIQNLFKKGEKKSKEKEAE